MKGVCVRDGVLMKSVDVCVCVCVRERERESVCECVCERGGAPGDCSGTCPEKL